MMIKPITNSLLNISEIMANAVKFVYLRFNLEKWEKEASEGNADSKLLIDMVYRFERLIEIASKGSKEA